MEVILENWPILLLHGILTSSVCCGVVCNSHYILHICDSRSKRNGIGSGTYMSFTGVRLRAKN